MIIIISIIIGTICSYILYLCTIHTCETNTRKACLLLKSLINYKGSFYVNLVQQALNSSVWVLLFISTRPLCVINIYGTVNIHYRTFNGISTSIKIKTVPETLCLVKICFSRGLRSLTMHKTPANQ